MAISHRRMKQSLLKLEDNSSVYQIKLDLGRTFTNHLLFKDENGKGYALTGLSIFVTVWRQKELFRVLKAISHRYPEIGYCQGMSFVAATLLMHMPPEVCLLM